MAEQIRMVLTVDDAVKALAENTATDLCEGNISAYIRGLIVFHQLLMKKSTGHADIPGWLLGMYPLRLIDRLTENIEKYQEGFAQKEFYQRVKPTKPTTIEENEVRINELARQLKVKAQTIVDLLPGFGVKEKKTHSSLIPIEIAERMREALATKRPDMKVP